MAHNKPLKFGRRLMGQSRAKPQSEEGVETGRGVQVCRVCGEEKPLSEYHWRADNQKHRTDCKDCRNAAEAARRYGLTVEAYRELLTTQCPLCLRMLEDLNHATFRTLVVDHCHDSGEVRGVICWNCNAGLGQFQNDPDALRRAAEYLEKGQSGTPSNRSQQ